MIDEREVREMLERRAHSISATPGDSSKATRRARRHLARNAAVWAIVGLAVVVGGVGALRTIRAAPIPAGPVQPSPSVRTKDVRPPVEVPFPIFRGGARPSTPVSGESVLEFKSWPPSGGPYPVELSIYADGRVIWHPTQNNVGYFQLRLTPAGVDSIRSRIVSTGLFDKDLTFKGPYPGSRLSILRGDRWVFVQFADASWMEEHKDKTNATPSESRDLAEVERLLGDPSAWQLSSNLYANPKIRPFVPSGYMLEYDLADPDLSQLPTPARKLLAQHFPPTNGCNVVPSDFAQEVAHALARAGFAPRTNTPTYLNYMLPASGGGRSELHLSPVLPDPCFSHQ